MLYTTYSKGYRLGGANLAPITPLTSAKAFYDPDKVRNVEVGIIESCING
jgi:outer membrane receptor protein involved in Fe transport